MKTRSIEAACTSDCQRLARLARRRRECAAALVLTVSLAGETAAQTANTRLFITPLQAQPVRALASNVLREARVMLDDALLGSAATAPPDQIALQLFADVAYTATRTRSEPTASGRTWVGTLDGVPSSTAAFARVGRITTGFITSPLGTYQLRTDDNGVSVVQEVADDPRAGPTPDDSVEAPAGPLGDVRPGPRSTARPMATVLESTVDLLVVYTPKALAEAGSLERLTADIDLGAALAHTALRGAGTGGLRVVHVAPVEYEETADSSLTLLRLWTRTDGFLDDVPPLRDRYAADLITLVTGNIDKDICGRGYITVRAGGDAGLNIVEQQCLSTLTLAHEIGHNLGIAHDWYVTSQPGYRPSSKGFVDTTGLFYTVMAYADHCRKAGLRCSRIAAFSNPLSSHRGQATGVMTGTSLACVEGELGNPPCDADAVSTIAETFPIVAEYRVGDTLRSGQRLAPGQTIRTATGCSLVYQSDGNLVLSRGAQLLWQARSGSATAGYAAMQLDGNLVVYDGDGVVRFDTATGGSTGAFLRVQNDCTAVIRDAADTITLWRSL